ncbi:hypothetical protein H5410_017847 [Solanum commersonii]|uniref:Uncharacterized protein n=1 Tax=Solanum commersonii TaxID=4109 RepID=A0A9J6A1K9_SOLCO|nr:hypothetical protein H5410_017847 [Solanum commersonii]
MASQENDRPQSANVVKRKSKGKKKVSETTGTQSRNIGEVGTLDASRRLIIAPAETIGFLPSTQSLTAIMDSIKSFYRDTWTSWGEIPTNCAWHPQHDYVTFYNYGRIAAFMLADCLRCAREMSQKPDWMLEGIWARLNEKWTTEKFQKTSIQHVMKNKKVGRSTLVEPYVETNIRS